MNRTISIRAIILGLAANIISGLAVGMGVAFVFLVNVWLYLPPNATSRELMEAWAKERALSTAFQALHLIAGILPPVICGYVAARVARTRELTHAFIVGLAAVLLRILVSPLVVWLGWSEPGWKWSDVAYVLLSIPLAVLGGYLRILGPKARRI